MAAYMSHRTNHEAHRMLKRKKSHLVAAERAKIILFTPDQNNLSPLMDWLFFLIKELFSCFNVSLLKTEHITWVFN